MKKISLLLSLGVVLWAQGSYAATQTTATPHTATPPTTVTTHAVTTPAIVTPPTIAAPNESATNPQLQALIKQQDGESVAFFQKQAADRAAWMKTNSDIIAKLDKYGKSVLAYKWAQSHHQRGTLPGPQVYDAAYSAFMAQQLAEKQAFLAKEAQARQQAQSTP